MLLETKKDHTRVADESLMDGVGYKGSNDLSEVRTRQMDKRIDTYKKLCCATVLFTVMLEIIEDLGTRYYAIVM